MPLFRSGSAMRSILRSSSAPSPLLSHIRGAPGIAQQSSWLPFKRFSSTSTSSSSPPRRSRPARHIRNTVYALCFASIGYTVGNYFVLNYLGGVEVPGSAADTARLSVIRAAFEKLDVTKQLRKQAEEEKGVWEEWEPYTNFTEEEKQGRLTSGCLNGSRAVAFQVCYCLQQIRCIAELKVRLDEMADCFGKILLGFSVFSGHQRRRKPSLSSTLAMASQAGLASFMADCKL